ncbi:uncharacterized protein LOC118411048 [Branchiostoma floridae]|uniref:Uncharacterized protein LOC118411048 n=1 Tax=Branchiostoma floridae TaxID=7739 RepID=A0A9J7MJB6_BRAFL|nr:uncharacterized protein LOC118411048 [Branchiostoma floridae]
MDPGCLHREGYWLSYQRSPCTRPTTSWSSRPADSNDAQEMVPWFVKVITSYPDKQHLKLQWHVPNNDGVYVKESSENKPLKEYTVKYGEIVAVHLSQNKTHTPLAG